MPSGPITKVVRFAAPSSFKAQLPNAKQTSRSVSQSRGYGKDWLSANFLFAATSSVLQPRIWTSFASKSWIRSRNPLPSTVHPGVSAFGYHQIRTYLPEWSERDTVVPSWFGMLKAGA